MRSRERGIYDPPKTYRPGDLFPFLGRQYRLEIMETVRRSIHIEEDRLRVEVPSAEIQGADGEGLPSILRAWYEGMAHHILKQRVTIYREIMNVKAGSLRVRMLVGQWGSCAVSGNLNFNARLVMAPLEIVDYVVVHELSHVAHHNHSPRFWALVESVIPDFRKRRKWLHDHGRFLTL